MKLMDVQIDKRMDRKTDGQRDNMKDGQTICLTNRKTKETYRHPIEHTHSRQTFGQRDKRTRTPRDRQADK